MLRSRGFGVRVWPSGRRVYILKYRTAEDRQRKVTIGQHGPQRQSTPESGAALAGEGSDPASAKSAARKAPTIRDLAERYMAEHATVRKRPGSVQSDEICCGSTYCPGWAA